MTTHADRSPPTILDTTTKVLRFALATGVALLVLSLLIKGGGEDRLSGASVARCDIPIECR